MVNYRLFLKKGIPEGDIFTEEVLSDTDENLKQSKQIMVSQGFANALLISDPLHMKRAMKLAKNHDINCKSSPTQTTMYKSLQTKTGQLLYETFYFSIRQLIGY